MYYKYASSELIVSLKGPAGRKSPANVSFHQVMVTIQAGDRLFVLALAGDRVLCCKCCEQGGMEH